MAEQGLQPRIGEATLRPFMAPKSLTVNDTSKVRRFCNAEPAAVKFCSDPVALGDRRGPIPFAP
jgi:hypothetical protein